MQDIRLLIVDSQQETRRCVTEFMQRQGGVSVREAQNGAEALEQLAAGPVDVMVTELVLPQMDGYTLLEELRRLAPEPMPRVIALTALARDDLVLRAVERGVSYYMVKPFDVRLLYERVLDMAGARSPDAGFAAALSGSRAPSTEERVSNLFLTLGIPAHIKGYGFLREAVRQVAENPDLINRITKELYPSVGRRFDTSASKVERAIRHAIEVAWSRGRIESLNRALGCEACKKDDKPTNGEFIALIADKLAFEKTA